MRCDAMRCNSLHGWPSIISLDYVAATTNSRMRGKRLPWGTGVSFASFQDPSAKAALKAKALAGAGAGAGAKGDNDGDGDGEAVVQQQWDNWDVDREQREREEGALAKVVVADAAQARKRGIHFFGDCG